MLPHDLVREILSAFWKIHILHHACTGPIAGLWMLRELRQHGYDPSPGTLYPMLHRMAARGWLEEVSGADRKPRQARLYQITDDGRQVMTIIQSQLRELNLELGKECKHE